MYRALCLLGQETYGRVILVRCDNTAAVSYINRQGGTRSLALWSVARTLFRWAHCTRSSYGQSTCRGPRTPSRTLSPASTRLRRSGPFHERVVTAVFEEFGVPEVDLLPRGLGGGRSRNRLVVPPGLRFSPVRSGGEGDREGQGSGVPDNVDWPSQLWFRPLLSMLTEVPRILPYLPDLLTLPGRGNAPRAPGVSPPRCAETVERGLREEGLSEEAASLAARGRRDSTFRLYDAETPSVSRMVRWPPGFSAYGPSRVRGRLLDGDVLRGETGEYSRVTARRMLRFIEGSRLVPQSRQLDP